MAVKVKAQVDFEGGSVRAVRERLKIHLQRRACSKRLWLPACAGMAVQYEVLHLTFLVIRVAKFIDKPLMKILLRNIMILRAGGGDFDAAEQGGDAADGLVVEVVHEAE